MCTGEHVMNVALKQLGVNYYDGGESPTKGFDSPGLVVYCYKQACGMDLPHQISELVKLGEPIIIPGYIRPGDLVFLRYSSKLVGIALSNIQMVVAPPVPGGKVKIEYFSNAFGLGRRLL